MTRRRKLRIIRTTIALVLLAGLATAVLIYANKQYQRGSVGPEWRQFCDAYLRWYRNFDRADESEEDQALVERMKRDPYLAEHFIKPMQEARDAGLILDPRALNLDQPLPYEQQAAHPPHGVEVKQKVLDALARLQQLQSAIDPGQWPAALKAAEARRRFDERGWTAPAAYLSEQLADLNLAGRPHLNRAIPALLDAQAPIAAVESEWNQIQKLEGTIKSRAGGDKILARFGEYARTHPADRKDAAALTSLQTRLAEVRRTGEKLVQVLESPAYADADLEAFYAASVVQRTGAKLPAAEALDLWAREIGQYPRIKTPDPRKEWAGAAELARARQALDELQKLASANPALIQAPDGLAKRIQAAEASLADVTGRTWDGRNKLAIDSGIARLNQELPQLNVAAAGALADARSALRERDEASRRTFAQNRAELKERKLAVSSSALLALWEQQRAALAGGVREGDGESLRSARKRLDESKAFLEKLSAELPEGLELPAKQEWNGAAALVLRKMAAGRREAVLAKAIEPLKAGGLWTRSKEFDVAWEAQRRQHADWARQAQGYIDTFNRIQDLLAAGYAPSDIVPGGKETIDQLAAGYDQWTGDRDLAAASAAVLEPLAELRKTERSTDRAALLAAAADTRSSRPALAHAAWKRLATIGFPASAAELRQEIAIRENLRSLCKLVADRDSARSAALLKEMADSAPAAVARAIASPTDVAGFEEAMKAALEARDALGLSGDAAGFTPAQLDGLGLDPRTRFNCYLYQARAGARTLGAAPDPAARERITRLIAELPRDLPAGSRLPQALADLLKEGPAPAASAAEAGPLAADKPMAWKAGPAAKDALTFEWNGNTLRFILIDNAEVEGRRLPPYYLCSTELSVGIVRDLIEATGKSSRELFGDVKPVLSSPLSWRTSARGIELNPYWVPPVAGGTFAPSLTAQRMGDNRDPRQCLRGGDVNPSLRMPMHYLSPESAMSIAAMLGCRLPTSDEWKAAAARQKHAPNLRDAAWEAQRQHIVQVRQQRPEAPWPDEGMFLPPNAKVDQGEKARAWTPAEIAALKLPVPAEGGIEGNDGALFFRAVDASPSEKLSNLVGNVAEYVWDRPADISRLPNHAPATFISLIDQSPGALGVVGGSALSPPQIGIARQAVDHDPDRLHEPHADVGLRLAFSPAQRSLADRLRGVLDGEAYAR